MSCFKVPSVCVSFESADLTLLYAATLKPILSSADFVIFYVNLDWLQSITRLQSFSLSEANHGYGSFVVSGDVVHNANRSNELGVHNRSFENKHSDVVDFVGVQRIVKFVQETRLDPVINRIVCTVEVFENVLAVWVDSPVPFAKSRILEIPQLWNLFFLYAMGGYETERLEMMFSLKKKVLPVSTCFSVISAPPHPKFSCPFAGKINDVLNNLRISSASSHTFLVEKHSHPKNILCHKKAPNN